MKDKDILHLIDDENSEPRKLTIDSLKEAVDFIFRRREKDNKTERGMKIMQYCKTNGTLVIDTSSPFINLCPDPECDNCRYQEKIFKEQVDITLNKFEDFSKLHNKK